MFVGCERFLETVTKSYKSLTKFLPGPAGPPDPSIADHLTALYTPCVVFAWICLSPPALLALRPKARSTQGMQGRPTSRYVSAGASGAGAARRAGALPDRGDTLRR